MTTDVFKKVIEEIDSLNPSSDESFAFTQKVRRQFIKMKLETPEELADPKQQSTLLASLKDMDKQNIDLKRIAVDQQNGADNKVIQEIVARIALMNPTGMAVAVDDSDDSIPAPPDLSAMESIEFSNEELTAGLISENSKDFIARMKEDGKA